MHALEAFNQSAFLLINATPATPHLAIALGIFTAKYLILLVPALLLAMWVWGDEAERDRALRGLLSIVLALSANFLIGELYPHPRPFAIGLGYRFIDHAADPSFPSDHTTIMATMAWAFCLAGRVRLGGILLALTALVGLSRIFLGVHFPLDILGGLVLSMAYAWLVHAAWPALGHTLLNVCQKAYRLCFGWAIRKGWLAA